MILSTTAYKAIIEQSVSGRYLAPAEIKKFLSKNCKGARVEVLGKSVEKRVIEAVTFGTGSKKILMWSQMHGNESTTTKACLDFLNFLNAGKERAELLLANCTFMIIPMLNPDGAFRYTRANANKVDLNRDAQERSQPESQVLRQAYIDFSPDFCFNLHDQRTIYNVGGTNRPATVSFLAPSHDKERSISESRAVAMQLIVAMNKELQTILPGQVARYDDAFNANCVGDTFQMSGTPTILFEAGHFANDYQREQTRKYIFNALLTAVRIISSNEIMEYDQREYFKIPENEKLFYDILVRHAEIIRPDLETNSAIGILYREELQGDTIRFIPEIEKLGNLENYFGHLTYNCLKKKSLDELKKQSYWATLIA